MLGSLYPTARGTVAASESGYFFCPEKPGADDRPVAVATTDEIPKGRGIVVVSATALFPGEDELVDLLCATDSCYWNEEETK